MKKFKCRYCGERFDATWQIAQHIRIKHKKELAKKKYMKQYWARKEKEQEPTKEESKEQVTHLNFCPSCGCNLRAVNVALSL